MNKYQDNEWEYLSRPVKLVRFDKNSVLEESYSTVEEIEISRDVNFGIHVEVSGRPISKMGRTSRGESVPGRSVKTFEMSGLTVDGLNISIDGLYEKGSQESHIGTAQNTLRSHMKARSVSIDTGVGEPSWFVDWLLNCSDRAELFSDITTRLGDASELRVRGGVHSNDVTAFVPPSLFRSGRRDHFSLRIGNDIVCVVQMKSDSIPKWAKPWCVEWYPKEPGMGKPRHSRKLIELIGFVLGVQPLHLGCSEFTSAGDIVRAASECPWSQIPQCECECGAMPPIESDWPEIGCGEAHVRAIEGLWTNWLEESESLGLLDALWLIWSARTLSLGPSLPLLAAALETLRDGWFHSSRSVSGGKLMKDGDFKNSMKSVIVAAEVSFEGHEKKGAVIRSILNSNYVTGTDRLECFFDELGIGLGRQEKEAFGFRNHFAHAVNFNKHEPKSVLLATRTLESTLNRVMLRMLGYEGTYVDYSTLGHPSRPLTEPTGGE